MKINMIKNIVFMGLSFCAASPVHAGTYLVTNATVTTVANSYNNLDIFSIKVAGGDVSSVCANQWINFPLADAGNADIYKRAYAAALTALALGSKISVYSFQDNSCSRAAYIEVSR